MKKFFCLLMIMVVLLVGCSPTKVIETELPESSEQSEEYKTLLSPNNKLGIVRKPYAADYSFINPGKMTELPSYNPDSDEIWQIDLRSSDLTNLDLSERFEDLIYADFDSKTQWPDKLPDGFEPKMIMELGKNPGLGLRELHEKGITGKGIGLAIIDQGLLVDHIEYKKQLKMYEEIHCSDENAAMHGPAVASIAVGKTVGVAPEADLYYIAETHGVYNEQGEFDWDLSWLAESIDRIVEINKTLPEGKKIRVISISLGIGGEMNDYEKVFDSIEKAKQDGIYTIYVETDRYLGLDRDPLKNPDDVNSFAKGRFWKNIRYNNDKLLIPMDSRCTASPTGVNDYVFYRDGGMSWAVPYVAGLYALACQVKPDITPEIFWSYAFETSDTISIDNSNEEQLGKIVNPVRLIENIEKMK
ncbi:S8/S53 family peptidase [Tissierella sp. MSJ-40]|uniref:S8/S53 family peptidase n=1 Tax=Tissierella simiarum TaxID=2841534 RepID=A0ABS6E8L5_9FIRM|nr:S8/S53 family peptidase [Tissierella simiarum]MBU5439181.1 S8/S53 family peptidase [Tissierella simiarum]